MAAAVMSSSPSGSGTHCDAGTAAISAMLP